MEQTLLPSAQWGKTDDYDMRGMREEMRKIKTLPLMTQIYADWDKQNCVHLSIRTLVFFAPSASFAVKLLNQRHLRHQR